MRAIWTIAVGLAVVMAGLLAASFLGMLHPLGDSLAVFRWQICAALGLIGILLSLRRVKVGLAAVVLAGLGVVSTLSWPQGATDAQLVLYQKNLNFGMRDTGPVVADIQATAPDVVTLQEVSDRLLPMLSDLQMAYPHQVTCPFGRVIGAVAVLSKQEPMDTLCLEGLGIAGVKITIAGGPAWVISVHLHWPWPYGQANHVKAILPTLAELDAPSVIAGDFNMVAWGSSLRQIRTATETRRTNSVRDTLPRFGRFVPLPIDHAMAPGGGRVQLRPTFGSDHHGLLAHLRL